MRLGKLSNEKLEELILSKFHSHRPEVLSSPHIGMDCASVNLGESLAVLSMDPITSATNNLGGITVHVNCNDAAAAGAEPVGLLVTVLAPPSAEEEDLGRLADEIAAAAKEANVDILGGHTEVTDCVNRMVTCCSVLAKTGKRGLISPSGMREGNDLVLTKWAGVEGTSVIAADFEDRLAGMDKSLLEEAKGFSRMLSVVKEGLYAAEHGATAMHDVTEGGVFGAAWELSYASGCGLVLYPENIPLHPATREICEKLSLDPMRLLSSGSMLIACPNGEEMAKGLRELGIPAAVIGRAEGEGVTLRDGTPVTPPEADELYRLFA
ncbi:MAG: AIR synthase family protein [Clostridia bacterium]|nr:AIR synthase family protein [Clostridia bacterium]